MMIRPFEVSDEELAVAKMVRGAPELEDEGSASVAVAAGADVSSPPAVVKSAFKTIMRTNAGWLMQGALTVVVNGTLLFLP